MSDSARVNPVAADQAPSAAHVHDWIDTEGPNRICRCGHIEPIPVGNFALGRSAATVNPVATELHAEFPLLWEQAQAFDFAERLGGCTDPLLAEIDRAMRELWLARTNLRGTT